MRFPEGDPVSCMQRARPKTEQEENELVVASLRGLYEELQRAHSHGCEGSVKQVRSRVGRVRVVRV